MQEVTSKIHISTKDIKIEAQQISTESLQAILDFTTTHQQLEIRRMKENRKQNLQAIVIGVLFCLAIGACVYVLSNVNQQANQEVNHVK
jgi:hypothetical protein